MAGIRRRFLKAALVILLSLAEFTMAEIRGNTDPCASVPHLTKYEVAKAATDSSH